MRRTNTLNDITIRIRGVQTVRDMYPLDHQHLALLLHVPHDFSGEILGPDLYLARCQRAGKCAR